MSVNQAESSDLCFEKSTWTSFLPSFHPFCYLFRATPMAYGNSQTRCQVRALAASLCHSHSNRGSLPHWVRPGIKHASSWVLAVLVTAEPWRELPHGLYFCKRTPFCHRTETLRFGWDHQGREWHGSNSQHWEYFPMHKDFQQVSFQETAVLKFLVNSPLL